MSMHSEAGAHHRGGDRPALAPIAWLIASLALAAGCGDAWVCPGAGTCLDAICYELDTENLHCGAESEPVGFPQSCGRALETACPSGSKGAYDLDDCLFHAAGHCSEDHFDNGYWPDCLAASDLPAPCLAEIGRQMAFAAGCTIDGRRYWSGAPSPDGACMACQPSRSRSRWATLPRDTPCEGGGTCATQECSAIDTTGPLGRFIGPEWSVAEREEVTCAGSPSGSRWRPYETLTFTSLGPGQIRTTSRFGCELVLDLAGDTANLSNGPVTCEATNARITVTTFAATTRDGRNLKVRSESLVEFFSGDTCQNEASATGTRLR